MEFGLMFWIMVAVSVVVVIYVLCGMRVVDQTYRGVLERLGKFKRVVQPGFVWIIPGIDTLKLRNITEQIADVDPQDIITKDNLNANVDLQVYYKVKLDDASIKNSFYNIDNFKYQIVALAQTTARNVIGDMKFAEVNGQRSELNAKLKEIIETQIDAWGVDVVRVELKEITPPEDVQKTMNNVIKAQNEKDAALDLASAVETKADGNRRAAIKEAEGKKQAQILDAEGSKEAQILEATGQAEAIKLRSEAAIKYFTGNAVELKRLEVLQSCLKDNAKVIITEKGLNPQIILGEAAVIKSK